MQEPLKNDDISETNKTNALILVGYIVVNAVISLLIIASDSRATQIAGVVIQLAAGAIAGAMMIQLSKK